MESRELENGLTFAEYFVQVGEELFLVEMRDPEVLELHARLEEIGVVHDTAEHDHRVDDGRGHADKHPGGHRPRRGYVRLRDAYA